MRIGLLMVFVMHCCTVLAQLNESDTVRLQIRFGLTGNYQTGNVDVLAIRSKLDFVYATGLAFVFKTQNSSLYQSFYGNKADNDVFSRNYLYYHPQRIVYPFAMAYISANFRRKIDFRFFTGLGLTWQLIQTKVHVLKLSGSVVYETTNFSGKVFNQDAFNGNSTVELLRGTVYMAGWNYVLDKKIRLFYDAFWQPQFSNAKNYRTQLDLGLDFPVWKGFALAISYTFTHENLVIKGVRPDDRLLSFGIAYNLKK
jgi:hypothetical protein